MAAAASLLKIQESQNPIDIKTLSNAINALLKHIKSNPKHEKSQLFEQDDILYLLLTLKRIPPHGSQTNPNRLPIPNTLHPFTSESTSICIILDDRPATSSLLPEPALDRIRADNLPIQTVIGLSQLKSDYKPYESRRKLCDSYDMFFADRKVLPQLPRLLGKHFFKRKKIPLPVNFGRVGWPEQVKSWCESSLLYMGTGTCCGLKIGRVTMPAEEIVENAVVAVEKAMEHVPKGWGNLRSLHVKTCDSVALPVYQAIPELGMRIEGAVDEKEKEKEKVLGKRKTKARNERGKRAKKGRISDVGILVENEPVSEMACQEEKTKKRKKSVETKEDANDETGAKKKKKMGKKSKKVANEENGELDEKNLEKDKVGGENVDVSKVEEVSDELVVEKVAKTKAKKGGLLEVGNTLVENVAVNKEKKSKKMKKSVDTKEEEENDEMEVKKKKMGKKNKKAANEENGKSGEKSLKKKKGDDSKVDEISDELVAEKEVKTRAKKGGNKNKIDVGEKAGSESSQKINKKKRVEKDSAVALASKENEGKSVKGTNVKKSKVKNAE